MRPPRDTIAVCASAASAAMVRRFGYYAVHVGSEGCPDTEYLRQN